MQLNGKANYRNWHRATKKKKKTPIIWNKEAEIAFEECKKDLINTTYLAHPMENATLTFNVDASNYAVGVVLHQINKGILEPLGFYSKRMNETQMKYSTYDRELLAVYQAVKHFKYMIEGRECIIYTDHKPIIYAFSQKSDKATNKQLRQLYYIGQYTTDIRHIKGSENIIADMLSRIESIENDQIDYEELAKLQTTDEELKKFINNNNSSLQLKKIQIPNTNAKIYCDISTKQIRPFIVKEMRKKYSIIYIIYHTQVVW